MKLIIKIPDEVYESGNFCRYFGAWSDKLEDLIENGTVLPKGHGDLIDRNALITELETDYHRSLSESGAHLFVEITSYIDDAKTIIEADKENANGKD